jgi:hypothetical protein
MVIDNDSNIIPVIHHPVSITKVDFELSDLKKAQELANKSTDLTGLKTEGVKTKGYSQSEVVELYEAQMQKDGWTLAGSDSWFYFRRGTQSVAIAPIKEDDAASLDYLDKVSPSLRKELELGDVFIALVYGPYEKIRLLGE